MHSLTRSETNKIRPRRWVSSLSLLFLFAASSWAHPLGNFSVNQFSKIEVGNSKIAIRQVLDLAEIPTFQAASEIDVDKDGRFSDDELNAYQERITPGYLANLKLDVNGSPLALAVGKHAAILRPGAGGLDTLRIEWDLAATIETSTGENKVSFVNNNFSERIGWREMVVTRDEGIAIYDSNAFGSALTDEIKSYPQESLASPLNERSAAFTFTAGAIPAGAKPLRNRDGHQNTAAQPDRLAELISVPVITPTIALLGLLLAFGLGAAHAMSPGHGKAVVGAYLVGSQGTPRHAAFLGLTVTITHTLGVFALGLVMLFASRYILPETIMPFLSFFSGLIVLYIGLTMFKTRLLTLLGSDGHGHAHGASDHVHGDHTHSFDDSDVGHSHSHDDSAHGHDDLTHSHDGSTHSHLPPKEITWRSLLALGISGGLLPCPSALVLMLAAINLNRVGYGLVLTIAFSFGLAATLTVVGFLFLYGGRLFDGPRFRQSIVIKALPVFSAFVIACLGAVICYRSLG